MIIVRYSEGEGMAYSDFTVDERIAEFIKGKDLVEDTLIIHTATENAIYAVRKLALIGDIPYNEVVINVRGTGFTLDEDACMVLTNKDKYHYYSYITEASDFILFSKLDKHRKTKEDL